MTLLSKATLQLADAGIDTPELDARLLLLHVLGISREELMLRGEVVLDEAQWLAFDEAVARRVNREPVSHILGVREFYGREFMVTRDVLDPRPDSETLIDAVLEYCASDVLKGKKHLNILDIGTGSGCLILTLLSELPQAMGVALDISEAALAVAERNRARHGLEDRLQLVQGSMFDLSMDNSMLVGDFDIIISNPPYISQPDMLQLMPEVQRFEPHLALDGGKDGLDCYRSLAKSMSKLLKPAGDGAGGMVFLEIGAGQADDVAAIFHTSDWPSNWQLMRVQKDLAGHERCMMFQPIPISTLELE